MNIGEVRIPDFAGTLARGEQAQMSRLQALAMQRELSQGQAVDAALGEGGAAALFGADAAARDSVLSRLAGAGRQGLSLAMPVYQQQQQRLTPMTPEQAAALGLRPGTVAMVDGMGRPNILQAPDTMSREAEAQRLRISAAGRSAPAPLVLGPGQAAYGRDGRLIAQGPQRPAESPFEGSQGGPMQILSDLAPLVANGTATPQQQRNYAIAAAAFQRQGAAAFDRQNPETNTIERVLVPSPLPEGFPAPMPFNQAIAPGAPAPQAPPAAAPAPAAPQQQGAVPIPGTDLAAAPPPAAAPRDPNAARVMSSMPAGQPTAGDRTRLRTMEVEAQGLRDALTAFRQARTNATAGERTMAAAGLPTPLSTAWSNAALLAKGEVLYNLGVLNGADMSIIQRTLSDPATVRGLMTGQETTDAQIRQIETLIEQRLETARVQYGGQAPRQRSQVLRFDSQGNPVQ